MEELFHKIPKVNRQHRGFQYRLKQLKDFVLNGPVTLSQQDVRELLGVHNVTLEKDLSTPQFKQWYRENIQPIIDRKKKEIKLCVRADLDNIDLRELRKR